MTADTTRSRTSSRLDPEHVRDARLALQGVRELGRGVAGPIDPDTFVHVHAACRELGIPIVLGGPERRRTCFVPAGLVPLRDTAVELVTLGPDVPDDTVAFATSSGTSGPATYSLWSGAALDYQLRATADRLETDADTRFGLALAPTSSYGFSVVNLAYATAGAPMVFEPTALSSITGALVAGELSTLDTIPGVWRYLATAMREDRAVLEAVRRLDVRGVGGEVVPRSLVETYLQADAPLHNGYGLTEAGPNVAISYGRGYSDHTVGRPLTGTEVDVSADGDVSVRSPSVSTLVWDATSGAPVPAENVTADGWLHTRDIGRITDDGSLVVVGRSDGMLVGNGTKVHSSVLEDRLHGISSDVVDVSAVQVDPHGRGTPRLVVTLVAASGAGTLAPYAAQVRDRIRSFPPEFRVRDVVSIEQQRVPVTAAGKCDRRALTRIVSDYVGGKEMSPCTRVF